MKKLSDYKGEEAILLWGDLLEKFATILSDKEIANSFRAKLPALVSAKLIINKFPKETIDILLRIDDTPVDGLNIFTRLLALLAEIGQDEDIRSFFGMSAEKNGMNVQMPTGSAMESTEESENQDTSSNM